MRTSRELLEKRAGLIAAARKIYETADKDKREPTAEEREQFDRIMSEAVLLKTEADKLHALETAESELTQSQGHARLERTDKPQEGRVIELRRSLTGESRNVTVPAEDGRAMETFKRYIVRGAAGLVGEEARALQKDSDVAGGYLSAPIQWQAELIQTRDNAVFMRQISRVLPPLATADSLGAPSLDADPADPEWTSELAIGTEDSTMAFGKRELTPHPLAKFIKVSRTLLRRSTLSADAIVRERLAYKMAVVEENNYLNGSGAMRPLGIFVASANGISTARDVSTGNTATEIRFDGLKEAKYALKAQYRRGPGVAWIFHRDAVKQIDKLKDGNGQYIWQVSVLPGEPDRLLSYPVYESEYAPNTFTTGLYVGMLGDFSYYWIVDALTMTVQVLVELYAGSNQVGYLTRLESDGMPVLEEAFSRLKLA